MSMIRGPNHPQNIPSYNCKVVPVNAARNQTKVNVSDGEILFDVQTGEENTCYLTVKLYAVQMYNSAKIPKMNL